VVDELRGPGGGVRVDRFITHVVNLPDAINGPRLATALVLPLTAPPALQPRGDRKLTVAWSASLRSLIAAVATYGDVPLTLVPQAETLQALALSPRAADRDPALAFPRPAA